MNRIGVLTSGGDAPGMNAAVRAIVRKAIHYGIEIYGVHRGFMGLINSDFVKLDISSVGDIIHRGGTTLLTARCDEFKTEEGQRKALKNLEAFGIEGIIVIGGDGSLRGANALSKLGIPTIGIPATIDNDIAFTDNCIGFDTAANTVVDALNKVRDTATSHERTFIIEVMGRRAGHLALYTGLASGAETILVPEIPFDLNAVCDKIEKGYIRGKLHSIIVVAEGAANSMEVGKVIQEKTGLETRVIILGHLQRGGNPSAYDRILASRFGGKAVDLIIQNTKDKMLGLINGELVITDIEKVLSATKPLDMELYQLSDVLSF
ncbi:MAG: 6-phosphofructokinase [Tepidanaerobacter acetatoxydans]|jgi:6-phosphofructokinase 1|uniref:ATP-dependent 6-phosphofructokinase n=1 Tax=Tepidanaerobacter acetatoxydans (strain DSM 21804 / JCM 16047 / Re1) TaxID=1209989 RepID=F4LWJ5_TEPAE|nr:6-phosphofructokinase [Tepidanaerobacter acetatoxydans]AEE90897.1 6-phosphofructokinase [Tepidanaerobacter acetatoxydans Re1]NLU11269.1 6-phosphofructokinase [Tepidanaerobacter acetatoxydans]CCP25471.1 6-phosphofructokinase [Tepidanaerobacter acetatoxydans Re1]